MGASRAKRRALLAAGATVLTTLVACNVISGLSSWEVCEGDACSPDAESRRDASTDSATDAQPDVVAPPLPEGANPSDWAAWRMPDPSRGDAAPIPTYNAVEAGGGVPALVDTITKLTWQKGSGRASTYESARDYCRSLGTEGAWRLPTRIELVSLLDPELNEPALVGAGFSKSLDPFFSSTPAPLLPEAGLYPFYTVTLHGSLDVNVTDPRKSPEYNVRCVLGGAE